MDTSSSAAGGATAHTSGNISSSAAGGATEHTNGKVFEGVLAFSNLGLAGSAVIGAKWPKHEIRLHSLVLDLFNAATQRGRALVGILLNEVGNMSDLVTEEGRNNFNRMLVNSFSRGQRRRAASALEPRRDHGGVSSHRAGGVLIQIARHAQG